MILHILNTVNSFKINIIYLKFYFNSKFMIINPKPSYKNFIFKINGYFSKCQTKAKLINLSSESTYCY